MTAEPHPVTLAAKRAGCAAAAAAIAAAATNPVETLRVKWQVLKPAEKSVLAFATRLAEREGFARGLALPGLGAWMVAMGGAFGGRMVLYEPVRVGLEGVAGSSPATASVAGFGTGMLSNGLMCPFFACKTRLQAQRRRGIHAAGARCSLGRWRLPRSLRGRERTGCARRFD